MISVIRNLMHRRRARDGRRPVSDAGFAMISVIGFGTIIVVVMSLLAGYAVQSMTSSRRGQDFGSAVQAAQAGVDDFMARLNAGVPFGAASQAALVWTPVPGAVDASNVPCVGTDATLPANCPRYRYVAAQAADGVITVTSYGKSRGLQRAVRVTTKKLGFTDYLYYSEIEAADPADGFAYPALLGGAPTNCGNPAWGATPRPASGCKVPTWRNGDSTDGSRVHTDDVFSALGSPVFDSRVTAAIDTCATDATQCVRGGTPTYNEGKPSYADDLDMPANPLDPAGTLAAQATAAAGGCTYYGPTRIHFENTKMRVWSPQTPYTAACGGGVPNDLLSTPVNVVVTSLNRLGVCGLLGALTLLTCNLLGLAPLGSIQLVTLSNVLSKGLLSGLELRDAVNGLASAGTLVNVPASGAIYVQQNALGDSPIPDPSFVQCLLGSALGMYSTVDTNLTAGLLDTNNAPLANCRAAKLFVDGVLDGKVTAGVNGGDVTIVSDLTYSTTDGADNDRLGLVATGPIEVYNPLQCTLAVGTCLSLNSLSTTALSALSALRSAGTGNLTDALALIPGYGRNVTVEASILSLQHRFGMQLPLLSLSLGASLLNQLVNLNITPPTLTVKGSIAQKYRGIIGADLVDLGAGVLGVNLASANIDMGFKTKLVYDGKSSSDPPPFFPAPASTTYDRLAFAEIKVP